MSIVKRRPASGAAFGAHRARVRPIGSGTRDLFHDEEGFSTVGMVLALLITLSLIFSAAQVYQVQSASADVQNVADAAALAAENEVAEFFIIVRVCDALVLSMSLTGLAVLGLGIAALCTPATAALSEGLIKAASDIVKARNDFARTAAEGLNRLQSLLPFISAANAASVVADNSGGAYDAQYFGFAVLLPFEGEPLELGSLTATERLIEDVDESKDEVRDAAEEAERAARKAEEEKERAFLHDCGYNPAYCMYERAESLANVPAKDNPLYRSADAWSFSVALKRAQAYYPARLASEAPQGGSTEEQARSALRKRFYGFAVEEIASGYVRETDDSFSANFPRLPKNTAEMRSTRLYTESVYPITSGSSGGSVMHAWAGCPAAGAAAGTGSIAVMESGGYQTCGSCGFTAASMGKVAAASTSIENGFEYHYNKVAEAAEAYQKAREEFEPQASTVKSIVDKLFDGLGDALSEAAAARIDASPPGRYGAVSFAACSSSSAVSQNFPSSFVKGDAMMGSRAAISAAVLVSDNPEEGKTVISSFLDSVKSDGQGGALGALGIVFDLWSSMLEVYADGIEGVRRAIEDALSGIPLVSASGLGTWAAGVLSDVVDGLGLAPPKLDALKPVLANTAHVLAADSSSFSSLITRAKSGCVAMGDGASGDFLAAAMALVDATLFSGDGAGPTIDIATIAPFGEGGPSFPITIALPPAVTEAGAGAVQGALEQIGSIRQNASGGRRWE